MEKFNTNVDINTHSNGQLNKSVFKATPTVPRRNYQGGWRDASHGLPWPLRSMNYPLCDLQGNFIGHSV